MKNSDFKYSCKIITLIGRDERIVRSLVISLSKNVSAIKRKEVKDLLLIGFLLYSDDKNILLLIGDITKTLLPSVDWWKDGINKAQR
jgi:hypothetical protein